MLSNSTAKTHFELPLRLMEKLKQGRRFVGTYCHCFIPDDDISRIRVGDDTLIVVVDRPSSYGNLGTIIRSCDALNVDGIVVTGHAVDIYDTRTIRASMGTLFTVPVVRLQSHKQLLLWFNDIRQNHKDFKIVGSSASGDALIMDDLTTRPGLGHSNEPRAATITSSYVTFLSGYPCMDILLRLTWPVLLP